MVEQLVAPVNGIAQRLLPYRQVTRSSSKQLQSVLYSLKQSLRRKQPDPGGGELNRQRQAVQPETDLSNRWCILIRYLKVRLYCLGALDKQPHGFILGQLFDRWLFKIAL